MATKLTVEDEEFLAKCEEEFKDRYTEKDEEYMKVFNRAPSTPPILENYRQASSNYGRRNDRSNNRFYKPYDRHVHRDSQGGSDRGHRRYNNHNNYTYNSSRY